MSVLIKGMDMPKEGLYNLSFVKSDGVTICLIEELYPDGGGRLVEHKGVVEIPTPHGRLIDADALFEDICNDLNAMTKIGIAVDGDWLWAKLNDALGHASTIIEVEK